MSDHIHIELEAKPWQPSAVAELVEVFHKFSVPLIGVIQQGDGCRYLFWCVVGQSAPESAWAYANVQEDQLELLRKADHTNFLDALRSVIGDSASTFAVASDEKGIIQSVILDPPTTFDRVFQLGMTEMSRKLNEVVSEYTRVAEQYPLISEAVQLGIVPSVVMAGEPSS
jgi:hypothetical protein